MINPTSVLKHGMNLLTDNAPALLTGFGAVGTVTTAVLAGKASFEAADRLNKAKVDKALNSPEGATPEEMELTTQEKIQLTWTLYVPAATTGVVTVTAIILSHRISSRRAAALAAAYALSENRIEEYQDKVKEKFGVKKESEVREEVIQDRVNETFDPEKHIVGGVEGKVLVMDAYTGRYLWSTIETIEGGVNAVNREINANGSATITDFFDHIGLPPVSTSDEFGWNSDELLSLKWTTAKTPNGGPAAHVFEFEVKPILRPWTANSFR